MDEPLSMAAQLEIADTNQKIDRMSPEQLRDFAKMLFRQYKTHEAGWRLLIAHQWGLDRIKLTDDDNENDATE